MNDPTQPQVMQDTVMQDPLDPTVSGVDPAVSSPTMSDQAALTSLPSGDKKAEKNPLDILEELLKDPKLGGGGADGATEASRAQGAAQDDKQAQEDQVAAAELAKRQAEYEHKQAQQQLIDQEQIAVQRQVMQDLKQTPQYQARVQQDEEKKQTEEQKQQAGEGFEIVQLQHTKV